jgi:hypothetical protein
LLFAAAVWLLAGGACASAPASGGVPPRPSSTDPDSVIRADLLRLGDEDQRAREGFGAAAAAGDTAFLKRVLAGDSARTARLKSIVARVGWPSPARVGREAAEAAWLLLQHSPDAQWQAQLLPMLTSRAEAGELPKQDLALLTDRVLIHLGQPQRYATQFSIVGGRLVPHPIESLSGLDERRAQMGLQPIAEYVHQLAELYELPVTWPPNP